MRKKLLIMLFALCSFCLVIAGCGKNVSNGSISTMSSNLVEDLSQTETECLVFELSTDKTYYTVIGYTETSTDVVIPEKHNGLPVQSIGDAAFYNCEFLQSVTIPKSVQSINTFAFYGCNLLQSVTIPDGVKTIGYAAFESCNLLQSVTIGNSVQSIGDYAFGGCSLLQSVTIPNGVQTIGNNAFLGCYLLAEVYNLSTLDITKGANGNGEVGYYALDVYTSLDTPSKLSTDENGFVIHTDGETKTLVNYVGTATEIAIPNTVTKINDYAFYGCDSLQSVIIPDGVQSIGYAAFYNLDSLQSVTIGNGVQSIGISAFYDCNSLQNVTIGNGVKSIGDRAFNYCTSLQSVTIGNGVQSIGGYAFSGCDNLESITFEDTSTWYRTDNSTNWQNKTGGTETSVATPTTNATYFTDTYMYYYWYKL